ncbi:MAG: MFS transporter, partial [bacterium]
SGILNMLRPAMESSARSPDRDADAIRHGRGKFACMAAAYTLGVFNDNFFKQAALVLAVTAGRNSMQGFALAVFTLPFIIFSAPAGWMADRFPKSKVVIGAKACEFLAMLAGAAGICLGHWSLIFTMLAVMGLQATFFSPALNGSLPELYPAWYIPRANGILRMLVTAAILSGIALAGMALDLPGQWRGINLSLLVVGACVVAVSAAGFLVSLGVPHHPAANPQAAFPWDGPMNTLRELRAACSDRLLAITIAVDLFVWFAGSVTILVINPMGIQQFGMSKTLTSGLIVSQLLGIGAGGLAIGKLASRPRWQRVLAPATVAMGWAMVGVTAVPLLAAPAQVPALFVLMFVAGLAGGVILIPVESFLQVHPPAARKGAVLSAVNFVVFAGLLLSSFVANALNAWMRPTNSFGVLAVITLFAALGLVRACRRLESAT